MNQNSLMKKIQPTTLLEVAVGRRSCGAWHCFL